MTFILDSLEKKFIASFRDGTYPADKFKHEQHLHLCWLYCNLYKAEDVIQRLCADIQAYTHIHGAKEKYNCTLTTFLAVLVLTRCDAQDNFQLWLEKNPDLNYHAIDQIRLFYSSELMQSETAKKKFVWPDQCDFPDDIQIILEDYFS